MHFLPHHTLVRFSGVFTVIVAIALLILSGFFPIPGFEPPLGFLLEKEFTLWIGVAFAALSGVAYFIAKWNIPAAAFMAIAIIFFGLSIVGENFLLVVYSLMIIASLGFLMKFFSFKS
ncbi:MAG: hypothetical protein ABII71_04605 [Candidatus Micrarchaeota archaeon]